MDIELTDKTKNNNPFLINDNNTINLNNIINSNNNNNSSIPNLLEQKPEINIFSKNKKSIYALNQPIKKPKNISSGELTLCEGRLQNDLAEFRRSKIIGKICDIKLNDYKKVGNDSFELIVDFIRYFSVKFIFQSDYPCSPPLIIHERGSKPKNIFDENGNVLIESIKRSNWTPSIWLSTLVCSIELLISSGTNPENHCFSNNNTNNNNQNLTNYFMMAKKQKYGKRKWEDYINEYKNNTFNKEASIIPELEKNLKQLKIK